MAAADVDVVRRIYEAWSEGDRAAALELLHPEIEWVNPPDAVEPGTRRGIDDFMAALAMFDETFEGPQLELEELVDAGGDVVVIGTLRGQGRSSGIAVERRQGFVWTVRDGLAVRYAWFSDPAEALAAAGVSR